MNKLNQTTPEPSKLLQPRYDRIELHKREAAVVTPIQQAIMTGALVMLLAGALFWLFDVRFFVTLQWMAIIGLATTLFMWIMRLRDWRYLVTKLEYWLGDLNNDGVIGVPQPVPVQYTINTFSHDGHMTGQYKYTFSNATPEQITTFCHKTRKMGFPISRRKWVEQGTFTDDQWRTFYGDLIKQKLITMMGGKNVLTEPEGVQWADGVISEDDPHYSPTDEGISKDGK